MKVSLIIGLISLAACGASSAPEQTGAAVEGRARAIDGDTVSIDC